MQARVAHGVVETLGAHRADGADLAGLGGPSAGSVGEERRDPGTPTGCVFVPVGAQGGEEVVEGHDRTSMQRAGSCSTVSVAPCT